MVALARLVPLAHEEVMEKLVSTALRATLAMMVRPALLVPRVKKELKALRDLTVVKVPRVSRDNREASLSKVTLATLEVQAIQGHQAQQVLPATRESRALVAP